MRRLFPELSLCPDESGLTEANDGIFSIHPPGDKQTAVGPEGLLIQGSQWQPLQDFHDVGRQGNWSVVRDCSPDSG